MVAIRSYGMMIYVAFLIVIFGIVAIFMLIGSTTRLYGIALLALDIFYAYWVVRNYKKAAVEGAQITQELSKEKGGKISKPWEQ